MNYRFDRDYSRLQHDNAFTQEYRLSFLDYNSGSLPLFNNESSLDGIDNDEDNWRSNTVPQMNLFPFSEGLDNFSLLALQRSSEQFVSNLNNPLEEEKEVRNDQNFQRFTLEIPQEHLLNLQNEVNPTINSPNIDVNDFQVNQMNVDDQTEIQIPPLESEFTINQPESSRKKRAKGYSRWSKCNDIQLFTTLRRLCCMNSIDLDTF